MKTKLYNIPEGSKLRLTIADDQTTRQELCTFVKLDGMYSVITTEAGDIVHLAAFTPLVQRGDYYEIEEEL